MKLELYLSPEALRLSPPPDATPVQFTAVSITLIYLTDTDEHRQLAFELVVEILCRTGLMIYNYQGDIVSIKGVTVNELITTLQAAESVIDTTIDEMKIKTKFDALYYLSGLQAHHRKYIPSALTHIGITYTPFS